MPELHKLFSPALLANHELARLLAASCDTGSLLLRPSDLVAAAICTSHRTARSILAPALRRGFGAGDLLQLAQSTITRADGSSVGELPLQLAPETWQALADCEALMMAAGEGPAVELLLLAALSHFNAEERAEWKALDVEAAVVLLREQVERLLDDEPTESLHQHSTCRFKFPPATPYEDLTGRWQGGETARAGADPIASHPLYCQVFEQMARGLHKRRGGHLLMVGERGVGKAVILAEFARRAAAGIPAFLASKRFLLIDARHTAPDDSRDRLVAILSQTHIDERLVLCIHGLDKLLRGNQGARHTSLLLSLMTRLSCKVIGLLEPYDYEELIAHNADASELFTKISVPEPDLDLARQIIRSFREPLESEYDLSIDEGACDSAVALAANYILNDQLPSKAVKVLRRICERQDYDRSQQGQSLSPISEQDVISAVSEISGIPSETLRGIGDRCDYERSLNEFIVGQDHVVGEVAAELGLIKAGMTDPHKPASVMLFVGQTGTGKTEMAKVLAQLYSSSKRLRTYTLGNFIEPHSVAGIIGVPPGYVGHEHGGRLVNDLLSDPYCVFLLDEADKSHPDVLQPFLNLFDEGWLRDHRGTTAYANKSIFILTSNVAQRMIGQMAKEGKTDEQIQEKIKAVLPEIRHSKSPRPVFSPELLARIKRVIVFRPLDRSAMEGIVHRAILRMQRDWELKRQKRLIVHDELAEYIARQAHQRNEAASGREGGRIVHKLMCQLVEVPLQREIGERLEQYKDCSSAMVTARWNQARNAEEDRLPEVTVDFHA